MSTYLKHGLWLHTIIAGIIGLTLYLQPDSAEALWPWTLPALAARFIGALLIASAINSWLSSTAANDAPLNGTLLMGFVLYTPIALTGLLAYNQVNQTFPIWFGVVGGLALLAGLFFIIRYRSHHTASFRKQPHGPDLRALLILDAILVAPVGFLMYFLPDTAQRYWPWEMSPINVRLIGSIFVATTIVSLWSLRQPNWESIRPSVISGGLFATLALFASLLHFELFNPSRIVTWAFIAIYSIVALGAWIIVFRYQRPQHIAQKA